MRLQDMGFMGCTGCMALMSQALSLSREKIQFTSLRLEVMAPSMVSCMITFV
jgi:hypothetical protein